MLSVSVPVFVQILVPPPAPPRRPARLVPWVEKYRPRNVNDISSQEDIVKSLRNAVASGNVRRAPCGLLHFVTYAGEII